MMCSYSPADFKEAREKMVASPDGGLKNDAGKPRLSLIESGFITEIGKILTAGAVEYGDYNWHGLDKGRVKDSMYRHMNTYLSGELTDTSYPFGEHLAAIAVNAMFLWWLENNK